MAWLDQRYPGNLIFGVGFTFSFPRRCSSWGPRYGWCDASKVSGAKRGAAEDMCVAARDQVDQGLDIFLTTSTPIFFVYFLHSASSASFRPGGVWSCHISCPICRAISPLFPLLLHGLFQMGLTRRSIAISRHLQHFASICFIFFILYFLCFIFHLHSLFRLGAHKGENPILSVLDDTHPRYIHSHIRLFLIHTNGSR